MKWQLGEKKFAWEHDVLSLTTFPRRNFASRWNAMVTPRDRVNPVTELDGEWNNFAVDATRQTNFHQAQPSAFVNHATYACPSVSLLPPANTLFLRTRCSCVTRHPSAACAGTLISSSVVCYMIATSSFQRFQRFHQTYRNWEKRGDDFINWRPVS